MLNRLEKFSLNISILVNIGVNTYKQTDSEVQTLSSLYPMEEKQCNFAAA